MSTQRDPAGERPEPDLTVEAREALVWTAEPEPGGCGPWPTAGDADPLSAVYLADDLAAERAAEDARRPQAESDTTF